MYHLNCRRLWCYLAVMFAFARADSDLSRCWGQSEGSIPPDRPNILWVTSEDTGIELGCYGDTQADTPNLDALAGRGMKYAKAWSNAPVCAPARTTILTGMYPTSLGAQHMRSAVKLPTQVVPYPTLLRELGYYCTNNAKTDYNLQLDDKAIWDDSSNKAHWRNRPAGKPFFAVFNFTISHESRIRDRPHKPVHQPSEVQLPPYHPDTPESRQDWAQYYDRVTQMDQQIGEVLKQLETDGLSDNTIVFYYGDHGSGMPRHKRWLYQSGLHVPMIVYVPERLRPLVSDHYQPGTTSQQLVSFVDLVPTILSLAGVRTPEYLQGSAFLGPHVGKHNSYLFGFRDRMDEIYDMSRAVRDDRFSYIRNFMPHRPQGAYLDYMFQTPTTRAWKAEFDAGRLNSSQSFFWKSKPGEELYDLQEDPYQINNLAGKPQYQEVQQRLSQALHEWMIRSGDTGLLPEGDMWQRAKSGSPFDLATSSDAFPVERILQIAELASNPREDDVALLLQHQSDNDAACRFWVATGLLVRAERFSSSLGVNQPDSAAHNNDDVANPNSAQSQLAQCLAAARTMATDSSPYVRAVSHEIIARFELGSTQQQAIESLLQMADPRSDGYFPSLMAMNCLEWSPVEAGQARPVLDGLEQVKTGMPQRYSNYVPRLVKRLLEKTR